MEAEADREDNRKVQAIMNWKARLDWLDQGRNWSLSRIRGWGANLYS